MTPELEVIKDQLTTRNVIRFTQETRYHVNLVRTGHNERVVLVTVNGRVLAQVLFTGGERLPALKEVYRLRKVFGCEGFENE